MAAATPAIARLDALAIRYVLHPYPHDPRSTAFGDEAVLALGVDADAFFKTLLVEVDIGAVGNRGAPLACAVVPVSGKLDLKAFSRELGVKRAVLADLGRAERSSGYVRGGISPIGQKVQPSCLIDETMLLFDTVHVSAGLRGLAVELAPDDLLRAADARFAAIAVAT